MQSTFQKEIPIFFAADENYLPYLTVALSSLKDNADKNRNYAIYILNAGIDEGATQAVKAYEEEWFTIRFVDVSEQMEAVKSNLHLRDYYTGATYYRIFIAEMFPQYDKAIYIDSDVVVLGDISEMFDTDLGDDLVGAIPDEAVATVPEFRQYTKEVLGIEYQQYFNAGVLLMNLKKFRQEGFFTSFCRLLKEYKFSVAQDQDYLNVLCKDRVCYLGKEWNKMPIGGKEEGTLKLIHYNLTMKPWHYEETLYKEYFWRYAKATCYYDVILAALDGYTDEKKQKDKDSEKALIALCVSESAREDNYQKLQAKKQGLAPDRVEVLQKIALYEREGRFDEDVEADPPAPELLPEKADYLCKKVRNKVARKIANAMADKYFLDLIKKGILIIDGVTGEEHLNVLEKGAVVTCNHFSPMDNYIVFHCIRKALPRKYLYKVIREGNYTGFPGLYGFFFRHCNTLPLSSNKRTMIQFMSATDALLKRGESILIYPEQAMWWNYKKPRPYKIGAFRIAFRSGAPVLPTFITMQDSDKMGADGAPLQRHTLHILPPVYPDLSLSIKEGAQKMLDEAQAKVQAKYEEVYGVPLVYTEEK